MGHELSCGHAWWWMDGRMDWWTDSVTFNSYSMYREGYDYWTRLMAWKPIPQWQMVMFIWVDGKRYAYLKLPLWYVITVIHSRVCSLCSTEYVIQIKICAEYRDMLPRPRLVCQEPGLRPIGRSPGVPDKSSRGLGSMSRYSAQILICIL